jgi:hypothetical protein
MLRDVGFIKALWDMWRLRLYPSLFKEVKWKRQMNYMR